MREWTGEIAIFLLFPFGVEGGTHDIEIEVGMFCNSCIGDISIGMVIDNQ